MNKSVVRALGVVGLSFGLAQSSFGQSASEAPALDPAMGITTVRLWDSEPPGSQAKSSGAIPTLTVFLPHPGRGNGTAVVIAPGGAYVGLASNLEGRQVADWFTARGVTAFVLKYRLGAENLYPVPLQDAQRAVRLVRSYDKKYGLSPGRVGMVGFSAGGHLAAMTGTLFDDGKPASADPLDRFSDRPDFLILAYPWLNAMQANNRNLITYCSVMQTIPAEKCKTYEQAYTPSLHVSARTPPTFIYHTTDDSVVPVSASVDFYNALLSAGVSAELHIFRHGAHGSGMGAGDAALDAWPVLLEQWLRDQALLTPDPAAVAAAKAALDAPARKPGEALSLDSRVADILGDAEGAAVVGRVCGDDFLKKLPEEAKGVSLRTIAPYFPAQLSEKNLELIASEFAKLPVH